jgi:hypothetical protein
MVLLLSLADAPQKAITNALGQLKVKESCVNPKERDTQSPLSRAMFNSGDVFHAVTQTQKSLPR